MVLVSCVDYSTTQIHSLNLCNKVVPKIYTDEMNLLQLMENHLQVLPPLVTLRNLGVFYSYIDIVTGLYLALW